MADKTATANPHIDNVQASPMKRTMPAGIQIGLEMSSSGVKTMRPMTSPMTVRPVRRRRMPPDTMRVRKPTSWVGFGACSWSLRKTLPPPCCTCRGSLRQAPGCRTGLDRRSAIWIDDWAAEEKKKKKKRRNIKTICRQMTKESNYFPVGHWEYWRDVCTRWSL